VWYIQRLKTKVVTVCFSNKLCIKLKIHYQAFAALFAANFALLIILSSIVTTQLHDILLGCDAVYTDTLMPALWRNTLPAPFGLSQHGAITQNVFTTVKTENPRQVHLVLYNQTVLNTVHFILL
jgi:succinate dehydrogenase hydrophobic anchor subunit